MGFPCVPIKMPKSFGIKTLLNIINNFKLMFTMLLTHLGLVKPTEQADTEEQTASYVLVMDGLCPVPVPVYVLTARIKKMLPVIKYCDFLERQGKHEDDESMCPVCLECIEGKNEIRELCNCSHVFHRDCLECWLDEGQVTCPSCRSMLFPEKIQITRSGEDWRILQ